MTLYKYTFESPESLFIETVEVEEKSKCYVLVSNHAKRILKTAINCIDPERHVLYLLTQDDKLAAEKFVYHFQLSIEAIQHTLDSISGYIAALQNIHNL